MTALLDRAARLIALLTAAIVQYRAVINRARKLEIVLLIDGRPIRLPFFDDLVTESAPPSSLDDVQRDILIALFEADGPLTQEELHAKTNHVPSKLHRNGRLKGLADLGLLTSSRSGYALTASGRREAERVAGEDL